MFKSGPKETSGFSQYPGVVLHQAWVHNWNLPQAGSRVLELNEVRITRIRSGQGSEAWIWVNRLPVDYPLRFSGPVTPSPPAGTAIYRTPLLIIAPPFT